MGDCRSRIRNEGKGSLAGTATRPEGLSGECATILAGRVDPDQHASRRAARGTASDVDHVLAAMFRVADETLALRIDNPIHQFQGDLADHDGENEVRCLIRGNGLTPNSAPHPADRWPVLIRRTGPSIGMDLKCGES